MDGNMGKCFQGANPVSVSQSKTLRYLLKEAKIKKDKNIPLNYREKSTISFVFVTNPFLS